MEESTIKIGIVGEASFQVTPEQTARHLGSGSLMVLATPAMVTMVERTCVEMVENLLGDDQSTVGVGLRVRHLAPTPLGGRVHVRAEVVNVEGAEIVFWAQITDEVELVGEIEHKRVVISKKRFMQRVKKKSGD